MCERTESTSSAVDGPREQMVILVQGEIDLVTAPLLERALLSAVDGHPRVCCDLTGVTFFGAAGLAALVTASHRAADIGCHLSVRRAHGITRWVLHVSGVGQMLAREQSMPRGGIDGSERGP